MRFHVVSLPHTNTTREFIACAYTQKVIKFCNMMRARGHTVFLYAGEKNEASCDELIPCIREFERAQSVLGRHYVEARFDPALWHWRVLNSNAIDGIQRRQQPGDFICVISGCHRPIAAAFPHLKTVEFGVGYGGTFSNFRVYESYAWMHHQYGTGLKPGSHDANGCWEDAVIPNYFDPAEFPFSTERGDYFLFVGRLVDRKGYALASEVCKTLGERLILAGHGTPPPYGEYAGQIGSELRGKLMSLARAIFVPTVYIEAFGGVAVEAMMCGTPVISTDWGAFTETVQHGVTGFRCRSFGEFLEAAKSVDRLDRAAIRQYAISRYSTDAVALQYEAYFNRLAALTGKGTCGVPLP